MWWTLISEFYLLNAFLTIFKHIDCIFSGLSAVLAGANITFRDLQIRLQVPLTLSGVHRACDLRLRIHLLELANINRSEFFKEKEDPSSSTAASSGHEKRRRTKSGTSKSISSGCDEENDSGGVWSWLWTNRWTNSSSTYCVIYFA